MTNRNPVCPTPETLEWIRANLTEVGGKIFKGGFEFGRENSRGYVQLDVGAWPNRRNTLGHHVVWFLNTGGWPVRELDHDDRNRANNRFSNLKLSDPYSQGANMSAQSEQRRKYLRRKINDEQTGRRASRVMRAHNRPDDEVLLLRQRLREGGGAICHPQVSSHGGAGLLRPQGFGVLQDQRQTVACRQEWVGMMGERSKQTDEVMAEVMSSPTLGPKLRAKILRELETLQIFFGRRENASQEFMLNFREGISVAGVWPEWTRSQAKIASRGLAPLIEPHLRMSVYQVGEDVRVSYSLPIIQISEAQKDERARLSSDYNEVRKTLGGLREEDQQPIHGRDSGPNPGSAPLRAGVGGSEVGGRGSAEVQPKGSNHEAPARYDPEV